MNVNSMPYTIEVTHAEAVKLREAIALTLEMGKRHEDWDLISLALNVMKELDTQLARNGVDRLPRATMGA
jgi:hypothetical protein